MQKYFKKVFRHAQLLGAVVFALGVGSGPASGQVVTAKAVYSLIAANGLYPAGRLCLGPDGDYYGTTSTGGSNDMGTIFKISTNGLVTPILSFNGTNGEMPSESFQFAAGLILSSNGNFYGTTLFGGTNGGYGTIFKLTAGGALTSLFSFSLTNGSGPEGLLQMPDGNLYGVTTSGGTNNGFHGTVFKLSTNGDFTSLFSFNGTNGASPQGYLAMGNDGLLYGATTSGGTNNNGTIFKITTGGTFTPLVSFKSATTGSGPNGVTLAGDGNFYGTTKLGGSGANASGTLFEFATNTGALTTRLIFERTNGGFPFAPLLLGSDGLLYGTANVGGPNGSTNGIVFKVATNGTAVTTLVSFNGTNGANPAAALVQGSDGALYGTTYDSLSPNEGTVFRVTTNGGLTLLAAFSYAEGQNVNNNLTLAPDGNFYCVASGGGASDNGLLFKMTPAGAVTNLAFFNGTNGALPNGPLIMGNDGNYYGTTQLGGTNDTASGGDGVFYQLTTNGVLTALASFSTNTGAQPVNALAVGKDGNFYGVANYGGSNGLGTIFRATTNGTLTPIFSFNSTNGAVPENLIAAGDGSFYGTTAGGGTNDMANGGDGTVFGITTNGVLTSLFSFNGTNGYGPSALVLGNDGNLYGATYYGGATYQDAPATGDGTAFKLTTNGQLATLVSFDSINNGANPESLLLANDGNFYGTTVNYGPNGSGTVYEITTNGVFTNLLSFNSTAGLLPFSGLTQGLDGNLYGATTYGGPGGLGTIYTLVFHPDIQHISAANNSAALSVASTVKSTNRLWASTNVTLPVSQWQIIATNVADIDGKVQFTDPGTAGIPAKFYRVSTP